MKGLKRLAAGTIAAALMATTAWAGEPPTGKNPVVPLVISQAAISQGVATMPARRSAAPQQRSTAASVGRRVAWTAIGTVGGLFAGGWTGGAIENAFFPCNCDDPGLQGVLIGAPIGAIAGGIAGFVLSK